MTTSPLPAFAATPTPDADLTDLFALSANGLLLFDEAGRLLQQNPPMQALLGPAHQAQA